MSNHKTEIKRHSLVGSPVVYAIFCSNGKTYIGSSLRYISRIGSHISQLSSGKHSNKNLQKDFNKFGLKEFTYSILQLHKSIEDAREAEMMTIMAWKGDLYNIAKYYPGGHVVRSVSFTKEAYRIAEVNSKKLGMGFSQYIVHLIIQEAKRKGEYPNG